MVQQELLLILICLIVSSGRGLQRPGSVQAVWRPTAIRYRGHSKELLVGAGAGWRRYVGDKRATGAAACGQQRCSEECAGEGAEVLHECALLGLESEWEVLNGISE